MKSITWLFFDLGGTLIDESLQVEHIAASICNGLLGFGTFCLVEEVFDLMINASKNLKRSPEKEALRVLSKSNEQYQKLLPCTRYLNELERLYPTAVEVLNKLSEKYNLGIIANQSIGAEERLINHGIHKYFSVYALSGELGVSKPDPQIFLYALKKANCEPKKAVYIGDRVENDIYPAKSLGFTTVRILQGIHKFQSSPSTDFEADYTIESLDELENLFLLFQD